ATPPPWRDAFERRAAPFSSFRSTRQRNCPRHHPLWLPRKEHTDEEAKFDLDCGLESGGRDVLEIHGQIHRSTKSPLVSFSRPSRFFDLAHLEHRRNQVAAGRLSLHHGPTVPACRAARTDRLADAVSLYVCCYDVRRPELDNFQCGGAVHTDAGARVLRHPARYAVLAGAVGGGHRRPPRGGHPPPAGPNLFFFFPPL